MYKQTYKNFELQGRSTAFVPGCGTVKADTVRGVK